MSKPAPQAPPKPDFMRTLLFIAVLFLGYNLYKQAQTPANSGQTRTPEAIFAEMQKLNADLDDVKIVNESRAYAEAIDQQVKSGALYQPDAESKKFEAQVLVIDTELKAGLRDGKVGGGKLNTAYHTADSLRHQFEDKPKLWKEFDVTVSKPTDSAMAEKFPWSSWKGDALHAETVNSLDAFYRKDLVWGIASGYKIIDELVGLTGRTPGFSYWFAALLLAVIVRAIVWPLSERQFRFGRQMSQLSPLVKEVQEKYKDDMAERNTKTMELYKEYGINPMLGCLPALIQLPFFLFIYNCMVHYQFEFSKGTFLWINPGTHASAPFFAGNLGQRDITLIILYAISMVISTLLTPVSDPSQVKQQRMMGIMVAVLVPIMMISGAFPVPAAFVLYWTFLNVLVTLQAFRAYRLPPPPLVKVNAQGGGVFPIDPSKFGSNGSVDAQAKKTGRPATHKPKKRK